MDCPALRELAGLTRPTLRDAGQVFEKMIRELGRSLPTRGETGWRLAQALAVSVVSGEIPFREAAGRGASLAISFDYDDRFYLSPRAFKRTRVLEAVAS